MSGGSLPVVTKAQVGGRTLLAFALVHWNLRRRPLPDAVGKLGARPRPPTDRIDPRRLSRIVHRTLRIGDRRPRCLINALVLYRLLREQGDPAELVIGLPHDARDKDAHAWVELDGVDVGPPPGRDGHEELARYA